LAPSVYDICHVDSGLAEGNESLLAVWSLYKEIVQLGLEFAFIVGVQGGDNAEFVAPAGFACLTQNFSWWRKVIHTWAQGRWMNIGRIF